MENPKIIYTKRKSICLMIGRDASLIVRAPQKTAIGVIREFIEKNKAWIWKNILERKTIIKATPKKKFVENENFLYLGKNYKLSIVKANGFSLKFNDGFLLPEAKLDRAKEIFINWYKKQAKEKITERVKIYWNKINAKPKKINISNACYRWGSCGANNDLYFNWKLIMSPLEAIDYVVAHELAHLTEKNHSRKFWNRVKSIFPEYQKGKSWLKQNGHMLNL